MTGVKAPKHGQKEIKKMYGTSRIAKPLSKGSTFKSSLPKPRSVVGSTRKYEFPKQGLKRASEEPAKPKSGPIFKEVIPMNRNKRQVFGNLSNSPVINQKKISNHSKKINPVVTKEDIEFESDPRALESILNNEGVTTELLEQNALKESRPSMVSNNTFLFLNGRPSLCRRVPIQRTKPVQETRRTTVCAGPRRVVSSNTKRGTGPRPSVGQRSSLLPSSFGQSNRHSLYAVVQGRFSNADSSRPNPKPSFQPNKQTIAEEQQPKEVSNLPYKSPPALRVQSREVRISASPALRIKQTTKVTPLPQRAVKKTGQRVVKWADENLKASKDNVVTNLFQDTSPSLTPMITSKPAKTPVSILKNRKHSKRNSLTPPMLKKDKKANNDNGIEEIVKPQVINDLSNKSEAFLQSRNINSKSLTFGVKTNPRSPEISAKKTVEMQPKVLQENSPVLKSYSPKNEDSKPKLSAKQEEEDEKSDMVEVDKIFRIMNRHMSKVKRRSVQAEFSNMISKISASLKNGLQDETILECEEQMDDKENKQPSRTAITKQTVVTAPVTIEKKSPVKTQPSTFPLTPGTIKDIRENADEQSRKDFDQIAMETEKINEELKKLKLEKERLVAFQEKVKKARSQSRVLNVPQLNKTEAAPSFSQASSFQAKRNADIEKDLSTSWDKLLKSDMSLSPAAPTDVTSRSLDTNNVSPEEKLNCKLNYIGTANASPQISALHLEKTKPFDKRFPGIQYESNLAKRDLYESEDLATQFEAKKTSPVFAWNKEANQNKPNFQNPTFTKTAFKESPSVTGQVEIKERQSPRVAPNLDFSFLKPISIPISSKFDGKIPPHSIQSSFNSTKSTISPSSAATNLSNFTATETVSDTSPFSSSTKYTSSSASSNLLRMKEQLEIPVSTYFSSSLFPDSADPQRLPPTPQLHAPDAILGKFPPRTPAAFRRLRMQSKVSPLKPISAIKHEFAQALLDEEVSLLTCRVVRPTDVMQANKNQDPVAHSLSHGDDQHFVPILKTPSATPVRNKRSSFGDSAFANYLRM